MTELKRKAIDATYGLYNKDVLAGSEYRVIRDGLDEIETLCDRDHELEELWSEFGDIPMDPDTERMEGEFLHFPAGTSREDIWRWFDERHSKGVAYLLHGDGIDRTPEVAQLRYRKQLCKECMSEICIFNPEGICMFPMVSGRAPRLHDDGCLDFCYKEAEANV